MGCARVLVAEDDAGVRFLIDEVLSAAGFEVTCVAEGRSAVQLLAPGAFDLVVSDVHMPGVDGFGVARFARLHCPQARILLMSGTWTDPERHLAAALECDGVLEKPFQPREFLTALQEVIDRRAGGA